MKVSSSKNFGSGRAKILVYADSGIGKTHLAKTLNKALIISAESGLTTISDSDIPVIDITLDDNGNVIPREKRIERLVDVYKYLQTKESQDEYETIFIDSLSEINDNVIEKYQIKYPERKDSFNVWNDTAKEMGSLIRAFRDLPNYNVVMTCLETLQKDDSGVMKTTPLVRPKSFGEDIMKFFDFVFYLRIQEGEGGVRFRSFLTQPTENIRAKSRINDSIPLCSTADADLGKIIEIINGKNKQQQTKKESE